MEPAEQRPMPRGCFGGRVFWFLPEDGTAPDRPPLQSVAALGLGIAVLALLIFVFIAL